MVKKKKMYDICISHRDLPKRIGERGKLSIIR